MGARTQTNRGCVWSNPHQNITEIRAMKCVHNVLLLLAVIALASLSGCVKPIDAIALSNGELLIDRNTQPVNIQVWNNSADLPLMTVDIVPSKPWIQAGESVITSAAPAGNTLDKKTVKITIDRRTLPAGTYNETIEFRGRNIVTKSLKIRVIQDQDGNQGGALNIIDRGQTYEKPYLISFNFRLEDKDGAAIVAEPAQFTVSGLEGANPVTDVTGIYLRRAAARQFKAALIFDYSLSMQNIPGAINGMEDAAKSRFLPTLNDDALVSLYEFHVETEEPNQVTGFTADKDLLINRINHIEEDYVGITGGSLAWDAIVQACEAFGTGTSNAEDRYILLFSNGRDTTSANNVNDVINAARTRGIRVFTIAFGNPPNEADLEAIATGTSGGYFPAANTQQLQSAFEKIVADLEGQYVLRWASLAADTAQFIPSFSIAMGNATDTLTGSKVFNARTYAGDRLKGLLRIVPSDDEVNSIAFLRADYIPRGIKRIRLYLRSTVPFNTSIVGPASDGLLGAWTRTETPDAGGTWIDLNAPTANTTIPFATFGPLLRFDFNGVVPNLAKPFDVVFIDDAIYTNGQSFAVQGYDNVLPAE